MFEPLIGYPTAAPSPATAVPKTHVRRPCCNGSALSTNGCFHMFSTAGTERPAPGKPCSRFRPRPTLLAMQQLVIFVAFVAFVIVVRLAIRQGHR